VRSASQLTPLPTAAVAGLGLAAQLEHVVLGKGEDEHGGDLRI